MNVQKFLAQLAQRVGGTYLPKGTTFEDDIVGYPRGAVIAVRKGYLVALAVTSTPGPARYIPVRPIRFDGCAIMVRFPASGAGHQLQEAIQSRPGFSSIF